MEEIIKVKIKDKTIKLKEDNRVWMPTDFGLELGKIILSGKRPNPRALELGCGSGVLTVLCGQLGIKVTGLDLNPQALSLTKENWSLNGLEPQNLDLRRSDLFSAMTKDDRARYSLVFSNPPTFPVKLKNRFKRNSRNDWELAGEDGREVLDAAICQSKQWLKPGGRFLVIATSKQGWRKTVKLMAKHWSRWQVVKTKNLLLADHYLPFIDHWLRKEFLDGEPRIYKKGNRWSQKLYFIEAIKE